MKVDILFQHVTDGRTPNRMRGRVDPFWESIPVRSITSLMLSVVNALDSGVVTEVSLLAVLDGLPLETIAAVNLILKRCPFPTRTAAVGDHTDQSTGALAHGTPFAFALGSDADLVYTTETFALHAPQAVEGLVGDYLEVTAKLGKNLIMTPYSSSHLPAQQALVKNCQGKYRHWQTVAQASRSFMLWRKIYEQIFCDYHQSNSQDFLVHENDAHDVGKGREIDLEETFAPSFPLAVLLPETRPQYQQVWKEWYEKSIIMPPDLWKLYRGQWGILQENPSGQVEK